MEVCDLVVGAVGGAIPKQNIPLNEEERIKLSKERGEAFARSHKRLWKEITTIQRLLAGEKSVYSKDLVTKHVAKLEKLLPRVTSAHDMYYEILSSPADKERALKFMHDVDTLVFQVTGEAKTWMSTIVDSAGKVIPETPFPIICDTPFVPISEYEQRVLPTNNGYTQGLRGRSKPPSEKSSKSSSGSSRKSGSSKKSKTASNASGSSGKSYRERLNEEKVRIAELDADLKYQRDLEVERERKRRAEEENRLAEVRMRELATKSEMEKARARAKIYEEADDLNVLDRGYVATSEQHDQNTYELDRKHNEILEELAKKSQISHIPQCQNSLEVTANNMMSHLLLQDAPPVSIDPFDGEPNNYHYFISTFNEAVERKVKDPVGRLTRLIQSTSGEAHELIKYCIQERPEEGYAHAKRLLKEQYGNSHRVASAYIKDIQEWPFLREGNSADYRKFYRFLVKCSTLLNSGECLR